jgi:hypothetical protein
VLVISEVKRTTLALVAAFGLPLFGLVSLYQALFSLWMCAHPLYQSPEWQHRFYLRFATTVVVGVAWLATVIWLIRQRRKKPELSE